ncbi:MAG: hypothetical protein ABFD60_12400 [Bryobacteraceae bacterium]
MSHNFKPPNGLSVSAAEQQRRKVALGTYICDLINYDSESLVAFSTGKSLYELALELGWILGAMIAMQPAPETRGIADAFENGRRLSAVMTPVLVNHARMTGLVPETTTDENQPLLLPVPAPSCELRERPNLQFYLLKPSGETVQ